jgi:hypothetical protein
VSAANLRTFPSRMGHPQTFSEGQTS